MYARPADGAATPQADASITAKIPARDALAGVARASARGAIAGVAVTADVEVALEGHPALPEHGEVELPFRVRYRLADARGNARTGEVPMTAKLLIDGDAIVVKERAIPDAIVSRVHEPPMGQSLPGAGPYRAIDAYLAVATPSAMPAFWP